MKESNVRIHINNVILLETYEYIASNYYIDFLNKIQWWRKSKWHNYEWIVNKEVSENQTNITKFISRIFLWW